MPSIPVQFNPEVSLFNSAKTNKPLPGTRTVLEVLEWIKTGVYKDRVETLRALPTQEERDTYKKTKLQAVIWQGLFSLRNVDSLLEYSHFICQDIDKLSPEDLAKYSGYLRNNEYVYAFFVSPSGNGLKILFKVHTDESQHTATWIATAHYLEKGFGIKYDASCKDISRLCFLSYDPDLYLNEAATIIDQAFVDANTPKEKPKEETKMFIPGGFQVLSGKAANADILQIADDIDKLAKCHEIVKKSVTPGPGTYNAYINQFAIHCNRYGISASDCIDELFSYFGWPREKETPATVLSVYNKFVNEHGKWEKNPPKSHTTPAQKAQAAIAAPEAALPAAQTLLYEEENAASFYDTSTVFWYVVGKLDKNNEIVMDKATGQPLGEYKYSYDDAMIFLQNNGYYKYKIGDTGYQFIHVDEKNSHVEIVTELRIKEFMIGFLKSNDSLEYKRVREMFRRGAKNYCSTGILEGLEYYTPTLKKDTANAAFVYFKNCFLEITAEGAEKKSYSHLKHFIWKRQLIDFEYMPGEFAGSDVDLFLWYASTGRKVPIEERTDDEKKKYSSLCTTIGYILHRYKSPVLTKAVIAVDKKIRRTGENNGRSGKSLFIKIIARMLNVVTIDGRNFSFDKDFNFQKVNVDTSLINFDDVKPNFDFTRLFSMITEEFSFEKKRIDLITIPFADAPKFFISSNSTLKGDGESSIARQQIIEFSTYFNSNHTPAKEFNRMFFYDWQADEWQRYYCFMVHCMQMYLAHGLIDFPLENYGVNKLIDTAGEEFIDYMDETVHAQLSHNKEFDQHELFEGYKKCDHGRKLEFFKINTFTKWVKMWADLKGLLINDHKNGERDKRGSKVWLVFTEPAKPITDAEAVYGTSKDDLPF